MEVTKITLVLCFFVAISIPCASPSTGRPSVDDEPRFARWLVNRAPWGVLTTVTAAGNPSGYVVSCSDAGTGTPYFYLSLLDPVGGNAAADPRACLSLTERAIGKCGGADAQLPFCSEVSITGKLKKLSPESWEGARAEAALFADHPMFGGFPKMNGTFSVYKLKIAEIVLVNKPASEAVLVNVKEYLKIKLD